MNVYGYTRGSLVIGDVEAQAAAIARAAAERGWCLRRLWRDDDPADAQRPQREAMLEAARDEAPGALLVPSLAHLWRPAEIRAGLRRLDELGIALLSLGEGLDLTLADHQLAFSRAFGVIDAFLRAARGERISIGIELARRAEGQGRARWGGGRRRRLLPLEAIEGLFNAGLSEAAIMRRLRGRGLRLGARSLRRAVDELHEVGRLAEPPAVRRARNGRGASRR